MSTTASSQSARRRNLSRSRTRRNLLSKRRCGTDSRPLGTHRVSEPPGVVQPRNRRSLMEEDADDDDCIACHYQGQDPRPLAAVLEGDEEPVPHAQTVDVAIAAPGRASEPSN